VRLRKLSVPIDGVMRAVEVEHREERGEGSEVRRNAIEG
jgi:hypothetical protein